MRSDLDLAAAPLLLDGGLAVHCVHHRLRPARGWGARLGPGSLAAAPCILGARLLMICSATSRMCGLGDGTMLRAFDHFCLGSGGLVVVPAGKG